MFSGFIRDVGEIVEVGEQRVEVACTSHLEALEIGAQIAIGGVRVSIDTLDHTRFGATLSKETLRRSTIATWRCGDRVNLERSLRLGDPVEGHFVQGHVDAVGKVIRIDDEPPGKRVWIRPPTRIIERLCAKGSIAIDGVSLTIAEVQRDRFSVALIPSTLERTTLGALEVGRRVNLESDLLTRALPAKSVATRWRRWISPTPWCGSLQGRAAIDKVVAQIRAGGIVLVWDPDREVEGDVIVAGASITPQHFTFILTTACSHATVPCAASVLERLEIPPMPGAGDRQRTWMHTSVDLAANRGTGVSAAERAASVRRLADPGAHASDFVGPGHVFPLRARDGGLAERAGHTEATVALCEAAGLPPVGVCCEVMNPNGTMANPADLECFALDWQLPLIDMRDLVRYL